MGLKSSKEVNVYMVCIAIEPYLTKTTLTTLGLEAINGLKQERMHLLCSFVDWLQLKAPAIFEKCCRNCLPSQSSLSLSM